MERIKWIDQTRGLAILLVILGHIIGGLSTNVGSYSNFSREILYNIIYAFHMPLIFAISGAVSNEERINNIREKKEYFQYLKKCIVNLYGTYLIFAYLFAAVKFFIYQGNEIITIPEILRIPFDYSAWKPGWYLLSLLIIKLLDFAIIKGIKNPKVRLAIWILLFLIGSYLPLAVLADVCKHGLFFQIGRRWRQKKFENPEFIAGMLIIAEVLKCEGVLVRFADLVIAIMLCEIVVMIMIYLEDKQVFILTEIGKNSMIPYVLHAYFTIPFRIILDKLNCQSFLVFVFVEFSAAIILTCISINIVKKYSCIRRVFYPI